MGTDQTGATPAGRDERRGIAASLVLVLWLIPITIPTATGCRPRAPEIEFANRHYSAALRTAANTKSPKRLARAAELIDRDHAAGRIAAEEYACYRAIIDLAEAGRWEAAEQEALRLRRDQQR